MRLTNSLFVQNNMANSTQIKSNGLAKNSPHFCGEQSQCATTPPGLARAYAGVKPLSFKGVTLEELEIFLNNNHKHPEKTDHYTKVITKVIPDELESLCVWMHSLKDLVNGSRFIIKHNLSDANLYDSTFEVAKNAIINAQSRVKGSEALDLMEVEAKLETPLKEKLGIEVPSNRKVIIPQPEASSQHSDFDTVWEQSGPEAPLPSLRSIGLDPKTMPKAAPLAKLPSLHELGLAHHLPNNT